MVGRVTPTILAIDAFETCFAGGCRTLGAGRKRANKAVVAMLLREKVKREFCFTYS
jgi:hypothetical protein